jgi:hypothetical protein
MRPNIGTMTTASLKRRPETPVVLIARFVLTVYGDEAKRTLSTEYDTPAFAKATVAGLNLQS